jgi:hypothetical protein
MPENELMPGVAKRESSAAIPPRTDAAGAEPPTPRAAAPNTSDHAPSDTRPDPLAPLNAMSAVEKIALFS